MRIGLKAWHIYLFALLPIAMLLAGVVYSEVRRDGSRVAAQATPPPATATPAPTATPPPEGGAQSVTIVGKSIAFDITEVRVQAGSTVTITFDNQDAGIPHDIAFYTDSSASEPLTPDSATEIETGPVTQELTFTVPEEPGEYFYRCDVHPTQMTGTLIVEEAAPAGEQAGGAAQVITIVGRNIAFDQERITVQAGQAVTIVFDNQDAGIPHDLAFYTDSSASQLLTPESATEIENGPMVQELTFTVPAEPGEYFYRCDVHPTQMTGTLVVEASGGS